MVFHWSLSDSMSHQVSRTLFSIMAVLNDVVVWMVSSRPPISKSSNPFSNPLVTVPNTPITIGIIVIFMFHNFFSSLVRSRYFSFFLHSFSFIQWSDGTTKSKILQVLFFFFFFLIITRSGLLAEIWWSVCMWKSHRSLCVLFSRTGAGLWIYHLFVWSNLNLLHISQVCLALYTFYAMLELLFSFLIFWRIKIPTRWRFTVSHLQHENGECHTANLTTTRKKCLILQCLIHVLHCNSLN